MRNAYTSTSGGRRDGDRGTSNGGKVDITLESALADLTSSVEVFLRSDAGARGKLRLVNGLLLVCNGLLPFIIESFVFEEILVVNVAPVMTSGATLAEGLVHTRLGLGSVLDYGTGSERTFGASHDGKSVGTNVPIGVGLYRSPK
jgi:hypothetical protein